MYSVILAAMLTSGAQQTQAWHWHAASCHGSCYGCSGCSGCVGCSGCYGCGGCSGHFGGLFHGAWGRHSAGCSGSACYGCNGFTGYTVGYTYWASGCYGSSCFGGCYGCTGGIGCHGWTGGYAAPMAGQPSFAPSESRSAAPGSPAPSTANPPAPGNAAPKGDKAPDLPALPKLPTSFEGVIPSVSNGVAAPSTARVVVHLPADAKLWVDHVACPLPGTVRSFDTPNLTPGAQYAYTLTVETPDGVRENRRITMSAGRVVDVDFGGTGIETVRK
jgi:uncharacterized protein (TIGR03000 family)